jgi:hypothetical protein
MADRATTSLPAEIEEQPARDGGVLRVLGTGVITGAADDDPSAIGTYASAGAKFGLQFLWIAPVLLPMMYVVVYVSAKLGQGPVRDHPGPLPALGPLPDDARRLHGQHH